LLGLDNEAGANTEGQKTAARIWCQAGDRSRGHTLSHKRYD